LVRGQGPLPHRLTIYLFSTFAWALWITRNKIAIEKQFPKAPIDVIYTALSLIQKWSVLLREEDRVRIRQVKDSLMCWLKTFRPTDTLLSDVVEI
jgi:hypothetical protein